MAKKCAYTVEPGRQIYHHGKPFISVGREGSTPPWAADTATRTIVRLLCKASTPRPRLRVR
jgi:hypothetical protein